MSTCTVRGCQQQTFGRSLCYFHRKQIDGIIPKRDRVFYLKKKDNALIGRNSTLTAEQHKLFKQFDADAKLIAKSFSSFSAQTQMNYTEYLQECMVKLWELIIYDEIDFSRNYKSFVCRRMFSACANKTREELLWHGNKALLMNQHWVSDLEEEYIRAQHQLRIDKLMELVRTVTLDTIDRAILNHYLYPMSHEVKSLRLLAKEHSISKSLISIKATKLLSKLRVVFADAGETSYWN